jgi:hypothetical protein
MLPKQVHHPYADGTYSPDGKVVFSSLGTRSLRSVLKRE